MHILLLTIAEYTKSPLQASSALVTLQNEVIQTSSFLTITHQIGQLFPPFGLKLLEALPSDPQLTFASVPFQLEELIINPLTPSVHV